MRLKQPGREKARTRKEEKCGAHLTLGQTETLVTTTQRILSSVLSSPCVRPPSTSARYNWSLINLNSRNFPAAWEPPRLSQSMHGCCQLVLSSHSVTARSPASLDLDPDDLRDDRRHQDGLRRQLTTTTALRANNFALLALTGGPRGEPQHSNVKTLKWSLSVSALSGPEEERRYS